MQILIIRILINTYVKKCYIFLNYFIVSTKKYIHDKELHLGIALLCCVFIAKPETYYWYLHAI